MEGATGSIGTITSALGTALNTASTDALTAIGNVLPYALGIMAAIVVITVAIRVFKRASR